MTKETNDIDGMAADDRTEQVRVLSRLQFADEQAKHLVDFKKQLGVLAGSTEGIREDRTSNL